MAPSTEFNVRSNLLLAILMCFSSCAKWCDLPIGGGDDDDSSTNNATTAPANNTTTAPLADCSGGALGQTIPYDAGGALPFSFEINARFGNIDSSTPTAVSGSTFDVVGSDPGEFVATYEVLRDPIADPTALESEWEGRSRQPTVVDWDGDMVNAWVFESETRDAVYIMAPHDGELHQATLEWTSPANCIDQRRALRDLATSTMSAVDETSFP